MWITDNNNNIKKEEQEKKKQTTVHELQSYGLLGFPFTIFTVNYILINIFF